MSEAKRHQYRASVAWQGAGTTSYKGYSRDHMIAAPGKPEIPASSDPGFRGDGKRYNPEDLLVASISSCQMLWYLHLCAVNGVVVTRYRDEAEGTMVQDADGGGRFERVTLHPQVTISAGDEAKARALHTDAHRLCFIANSLNFPVDVQPVIEIVA